MKLGINGLALIQIHFLLIAPYQRFGQKLMGDYDQIMIVALQYFGNIFLHINVLQLMRKKSKKDYQNKKLPMCKMGGIVYLL